ncbi:MAG: arsenite methyltransferase [candidate division KSB1 bacterium]|nr:arsenite methyltransferase [candidate division KSB1 bacterium]MDZ7402393.1 arsenite methyltransferase [candidate division KSB1 bacterium]
MKEENIRKVVRERYGKIAKEQSSCCGPSVSCCCGGDTISIISKNIGYSDDELNAVPEGANLGLGCGNPIALASLVPGEIVVDLGSGAGFDCFLAAQKVGPTGRVIGVDMTPDMIETARANARKGNYTNVEFRLGEIEHLPVADNFANIIISNCVINLSPDKAQVFREAYRVLKPGGRLMISDIVLLAELPGPIRESIDAYTGCLAGALLKEDYLGKISAAGFQQVEVADETIFPLDLLVSEPEPSVLAAWQEMTPQQQQQLAQSIHSIKVSARKLYRKLVILALGQICNLACRTGWQPVLQRNSQQKHDS